MNYPVVFIVLLIVFAAIVVWLAPKVWRGIKRVLSKIKNWLGKSGPRTKELISDSEGVDSS